MHVTTKNNLPPMLSCFNELKDPRVVGRCLYQTSEIVALTFSAVISGARHWTQIEKFGQIHVSWLKKFCDFTHGIPSHYTLGRFWSSVSPESFLKCFKRWLQDVTVLTKNRIIAIDGKTSRATRNSNKGIKPTHIVNAFDTHSNLTLGQFRVPEKTNEIKAIPPLLKTLEISGSLITIDAMGCQRGIAKLIKNRGSDYVMAVKMNQGRLCKELARIFNKAESLNYNAMVYRTHETKNYAHGRIEEREITVLPQCYNHALKKRWPGLQSFVQVRRTRIVGDDVSYSTHYYISSLEMKKYKTIAKAIRAHWRVENNCHWQLDNTFLEDRCTARRGFASECFSLIRKFVMNLLTIKRRGKLSLEAMRLEAAWDRRYLNRLLT